MDKLDTPCSKSLCGPHCNPYCLYDIVNDSSERHDLSKERQDILKDLLNHYNKFSAEPRDMEDQGIHSNDEIPFDETACDYMWDHGGYWRPWKD